MENICSCSTNTTCDCGPEQSTKQETLSGFEEGHKANLDWLEQNSNQVKQETLKEAAERFYGEEEIVNDYDISGYLQSAFLTGAKWKQERSYSEKDMKSAFEVGFSIGYERDIHAINENNRICKEWFEQFKK